MYRLADAETVDVSEFQTAVKGRLEYKHNGNWGTACDDNANEAVAKVFCRTVHLPNSNAKILRNFGGGQGEILFINLRCRGSEDQITSCSRYNKIGIGNVCDHTEDLGVLCY